MRTEKSWLDLTMVKALARVIPVAGWGERFQEKMREEVKTVSTDKNF